MPNYNLNQKGPISTELVRHYKLISILENPSDDTVYIIVYWTGFQTDTTGRSCVLNSKSGPIFEVHSLAYRLDVSPEEGRIDVLFSCGQSLIRQPVLPVLAQLA